MPHRRRRTLALSIACSAAAALSACGSEADTNAQAGSSSAKPTVVVGFYPLEFITERVAGDLASVETLTAPGAEPHDVELSPQAVGSVGTADLVLYSSGLQAAVDAAVDEQGGDHALDVNPFADLISTGATQEHEGEAEGDAHAGEEHTEDSAALDPHFWLDPARMSDVTQGVTDALVEQDPAHKTAYQNNADALISDLGDLDAAFTTGLSTCEQPDMVTTHEAFGYLASKYGLNQIGITGISPDAEPSAARLAEVAGIVKETGVDTIYSEVLIGAGIAQTVADETGAAVLTLDPVEGLTDASAGSDYLEVMQANLDALRKGQHCS